MSVDGIHWLAYNGVIKKRLNRDGSYSDKMVRNSYFDTKEDIYKLLKEKGLYHND